jgi:methionine-rich copper-binding protein CopC
LLLAATIAAPVLGHAELAASDPADEAVLATPPIAITLTFTESLDAAKRSFKLVGPDGTVGTGKVAGEADVMVLDVAGADGTGLAPGGYEVQWTAAAEDGHLERGVLTFTVLEPTPAPPTPTPTPAATAASTAAPSASSASSPAASGTPRPAASAPPSTPASGTTGDVVVPILAALVLLALAGGYVLRRSRRA